MSRIGKEPVKLAEGVTASVEGQKVTVKGKLGELSYTMHEGITAKVEDGAVKVACADDYKLGNFHGLARALIHNMVVGVSQGYQKQLSIEGTGFKAVLKGSELSLSLGFASPKVYTIPAGLTVTVENDGLQVTIKGFDKQMVGEAAARIRSYYPAEPYKGKGIKYVGEHIRRKQGKKVA
ncbi:MAG: 50S ribosomal protein L6 [Kiritimatiellae bacterium]|nr:50S ribosomal protein L6 [Kiritimatiellia bacterium]